MISFCFKFSLIKVTLKHFPQVPVTSEQAKKKKKFQIELYYIFIKKIKISPTILWEKKQKTTNFPDKIIPGPHKI